MAWLTRTNWVVTDKPSYTDFNNFGLDIRTWGDDVNAGGYRLLNSAAIVLNPGTLPSSPTAGMLAMNASNSLYAHNGSAWVQIFASQTPWASDISGGGYKLTSVAAITLTPAALPGSPAAGMLAVDSGGRLNVYSGSAWALFGQTPWSQAVDAGGYKLSNIPSVTFNSGALPTPATGMVAVDANKRINVYSGSAWATLAPQTPWLSAIDAGAFGITNLASFVMNNGALPTPATGMVAMDSNKRLNVYSGTAWGVLAPQSPWIAAVDAGAFGLTNVGAITLNDISLPGGPTAGQMIVNSSRYKAWDGSAWRLMGFPDPGSNGVLYRSAQDTLAVATGANLPLMTGDAGAGGAAGAVPAPAAGDAAAGKYLKADGTWAAPAGGGGGGLGDPGSNCVVFRSSLNTTRAALAADLPAHAVNHQNGGADEIAVASAAANAIPKAGSGGKLDKGWLPTMVASGASHAPGAVPDPPAVAGSTKFLREDATWATTPATAATINRYTQASIPAASLHPGEWAYITDFAHWLYSDGTSWSFADEGSGYIMFFTTAPGVGWALCNGSSTTYLKGDGTTSSITLPNLSGSPAYPKSASSYTGSVVASNIGVSNTLGITDTIAVSNGTLAVNKTTNFQGQNGNYYLEIIDVTLSGSVSKTGTVSLSGSVTSTGSDPAHIDLLPYFRR